MSRNPRRRRFLFVMQYPGYLRYFDSTVRGLAARGHHVDVVTGRTGTIEELAPQS